MDKWKLKSQENMKSNPIHRSAIILVSVIVMACSTTRSPVKDKHPKEKTKISIGFFVFDDAAVDVANDISGAARLHFKKVNGQNRYLLSNNQNGKIDSVLFYGDKLISNTNGTEILKPIMPDSVIINNSIEKTTSLAQHNLHWGSVNYEQLIDVYLDNFIFLCKKQNVEVQFVTIKCYDSISPLSDGILKMVSSKKHGNEFYDALDPEEYAEAKIKYFNNTSDRTFIKKVLGNITHPEKYDF